MSRVHAVLIQKVSTAHQMHDEGHFLLAWDVACSASACDLGAGPCRPPARWMPRARRLCKRRWTAPCATPAVPSSSSRTGDELHTMVLAGRPSSSCICPHIMLNGALRDGMGASFVHAKCQVWKRGVLL